jgi:FMN reductase
VSNAPATESGEHLGDHVHVVALGGSTSPMAASERALRLAAVPALAAGARVTFLTGRDLIIPIYDTETHERTLESQRVVDALRTADGLILASPGYHGSVSGMVKNVLDYAEDLRHEERPYLTDRAVGIISVAHGWQTAVATLNELRVIVHALRGWPTPLGVAINDAAGLIGADESDTDPAVARQLRIMGEQVVDFARAIRARDTAASS